MSESKPCTVHVSYSFSVPSGSVLRGPPLAALAAPTPEWDQSQWKTYTILFVFFLKNNWSPLLIYIHYIHTHYTQWFRLLQSVYDTRAYSAAQLMSTATVYVTPEGGTDRRGGPAPQNGDPLQL